MWRTIQSSPSAIWLTFVLPAPRTEGAVEVSSEHHHLPLLGNVPAHHRALGFPQRLVCSPAEVKDPSRVEHPSRLEQGLSTMAQVARVYQSLYGPCDTYAMKKAVLCGRHDPSICPTARHTSTALSSPTTQWYRQRLRVVPLTSSPQITPWVRQLESTCNLPLEMCNSQCQEAMGNW